MMPIEAKEKALQAYINKMPSLPTTVTKIMEICNNPTTSPADLNKVIGLDPVLMAKVMKLINSAYYGLSQEITSLVRAIIMLGINTVKNLALSTAVLGNLGNKSNFQALNMDGFWRHSLGVGVAAKMIAKQRKIDPKKLEEYFIAGLLHDIGKIPLNNRFADDYIATMALSDRQKMPLHTAETESMQINHTEVGLMIGDAWKLGEDIKECIQYHHGYLEYEGKNKDLLFTVVFANYFANIAELGFSGDRYPEKVDSSVTESLQVSIDYLDEVEDAVLEQIEKARIFLQLAV
jgi:putative nucleotidyltransferase with HDIG domain